MGMFDYLRCEYELPSERPYGGVFQTKDTPSQYLDDYRIDAEGRLHVEDYDIEDRSDPNAKGIGAMAGCMTRVNKREVFCDNFTGEINFYNTQTDEGGWIEYSSHFERGIIQRVELVEYTPPSTTERT